MRDRRDYPGGIQAACALAACVLVACNEPADSAAAGTVAAVADTGRGYVIEPLRREALSLEGAAESLDDLLRTVERGLSRRDTARLYDLMVDEREYRDILFPALPASHPPINASFETVWILQYPDSYRGLQRILQRYGGRDVSITAIRFDEPDQDFVNFVLHQTSRVDVTIDGEALRNVRLFGSVIRVGEQWKVLTYPDHPDDPS